MLGSRFLPLYLARSLRCYVCFVVPLSDASLLSAFALLIAFAYSAFQDLPLNAPPNNFLCFLGDPDYKMKCIGFWKENLRSYLITYDELDAFSRYRCWVYQRADLTKIYMSQALGPYCPLNQDVTSWNYTEGAAVHLNMEEYERERE